MRPLPLAVVLAGDLTASVLALLGLLHIYWASRSGSSTTGAVPEVNGKPLFRPGRAATFAVAVALFAAAAILAGQLGQVRAPLPSWMFEVGSWGVATIFLARAIGDFRYVGFFKRVRGTRFATMDSALYSPLVLGIALASAATAWWGSR